MQDCSTLRSRSPSDASLDVVEKGASPAAVSEYGNVTKADVVDMTPTRRPSQDRLSLARKKLPPPPPPRRSSITSLTSTKTEAVESLYTQPKRVPQFEKRAQPLSPLLAKLPSTSSSECMPSPPPPLVQPRSILKRRASEEGIYASEVNNEMDTSDITILSRNGNRWYFDV